MQAARVELVVVVVIVVGVVVVVNNKGSYLKKRNVGARFDRQ